MGSALGLCCLVQCSAFPAFPIIPGVFGEGRRGRKQLGSSVPLSPRAKESHSANTSAGQGVDRELGQSCGAWMSSQRKPRVVKCPGEEVTKVNCCRCRPGFLMLATAE